VFDSRRVHLLLIGGLGNQLFQLAAGLYINDNSKLRIRFSSSWFSSTQRFRRMRMTPRQMLISEILLDEEQSSLSRRKVRLVFFCSRFIRSLVVSESDANDTPLERISSSTKLLSGYFQNYRYVESVQDSLLKRFSESETFKTLIPRQLKPRIAIHIRLGDYVDDASARAFHGLTSIEYYVTAAHQMIQETGLREILIISDDPRKARNMFTAAFEMTDIEISHVENSTEMEDLALLSHSAGIVISNSSFSWWAAWLGSNTLGARVIAPTPWFAQPSAADVNLRVSSWTYLYRPLSPPEVQSIEPFLNN
jgi:hypothetical protein